MKYIILLIVVSFAIIGVGCAVQSAQNIEKGSVAVPDKTPELKAQTSDARQPVLVELFTSEGCSSCPSADRQLTFLEKQQPVSGAEVITLAFHVDYWDRLGWKDAFSSAAYSERQNDYSVAKKLDSNYTPQMIVDGEQEFVGSNADKANNAITTAVSRRKGKVNLTAAESILKINIDDIPKHEAATVYLAAAEDNIVTNVRSGENSGRRLEHTSVVRDLKDIGSLGTSESNYKASVEVPVNAAWKKDNLKYIVFVQENASKKIIAVGRAKAATK